MSEITIHKKDIKKGLSLPVMEHFFSIQGEGFHSGKAFYFIRIAGCDVGCSWCDVKESWEIENHPVYKIHQILQFITNSKVNRVVITGGEPLLYYLDPLCIKLAKKGILTHIETSGSHPISGIWDWFTLSPKKRKLPNEESYQKANELKIIISRLNDLKFAESQASKVSEDCKLFLQPEWSKSHLVLPTIIKYVKDNPKWNISLQIHKFMNIL